MKMTALVLLFMFYGNISKGAPEKQQNGIVPDKQELTVLLKKSSNPNNEQQANRIRVKLWFYWEKDFNGFTSACRGITRSVRNWRNR